MAGAKGRRWKCAGRPCSVCGRWFTPPAHLAKRQRLCGRSECRRAMHRQTQRRYRESIGEEVARGRLRERLHAGEDNAEGPLAPLNREAVVGELGEGGAVVLEEIAQMLRDDDVM